MTRPLSHLRVLDLTRLLPGGFCTLLLADLGADVIKVEEPGKGDYIRWMPPMAGDVSAGHIALNRGKRSITLNLKDPGGAAAFRRLADGADVVIESFRPGVMDRLGIGPGSLTESNPRLVYCAVTGYGQDGPYRERAGHDINYIGFAGVLDLMGERDRGPVVPGVQVGDLGGGALMAAIGILAALNERERTGRGRVVDISMTDGAFAWHTLHGQSYLVGDDLPRRGAMRLSGELACYRVYRCRDGRWVTVGALEPQFWRALCEAVGAPDLVDKHFAPPEVQDESAARLQEIFLREDRDAWVDKLADLDACFGPVKDVAEAFEDPQLLARGMIREMETADGVMRVIGNPVKLVGAQDPRPAPPPGFGEHTDEVLRAAGFDDDAIDSLRAAGAI